MLKVSLLVVVALVQVFAAPSVFISPSLKHDLTTKATANILVTMRERTLPVLSQIKARNFQSRSERLNTVAHELRELASRTQKSVLGYLSGKSNIEVRSFWITNQIFIKNADAKLVSTLASMPEVSRIEEDRVIPMNWPVSKVVAEEPSPNANEWGVTMIEAQAVWDMGINGTGVLVGSIDTGVRLTHKTLYRAYVGEYGWMDPYDSSDLPQDDNGHGTHTMGTILGQGGIGVAPGAMWMSCKGCGSFGCDLSALTGCGEFMACPTLPDGSNPDCSKAPRLVSNSWGGGGGQDFYDDVVAAWNAGGIVGLFSNGNSGPYCGTAGSPADSPMNTVIAVGSTTVDEEISDFSSVGPSFFDEIKPDIAAPGSDVRSAYNTGDEAYTTMSGTSMACPHAAGVVALMFSQDSTLDVEAIRTHLFAGATHTIAETGQDCGDVPESTYPNNVVGWGRVSAPASIASLKRQSKL